MITVSVTIEIGSVMFDEFIKEKTISRLFKMAEGYVQLSKLAVYNSDNYKSKMTYDDDGIVTTIEIETE